MRLIVSVCSLLILLCAAPGLCSRKARSTIDTEHPAPVSSDWKRIEPARSEETVRLTIALKQRNLDILEKTFWDVSDPRSPNYGKYLTPRQIAEIVAPAEETIQEVNKWLDEEGVTKRTLNLHRDMITINVTVSQAQQILDTQYHVYEHLPTGKRVVRSLGPYTAPRSVVRHLDFVIGGVGLPMDMEEPPIKIMTREEKRGTLTVTPSTLRLRYNITKSQLGGHKGNRQAVVEFLSNFYNPGDLQAFFAQFWPETEFNSTISTVIGSNNPNQATAHANADLQYIMGVAPNVPTWFWSHTGSDFWSDLTEWVNQVTTDEGRMPWVYAVTYGNVGEGPSEEYRDRLNVEFQKLGLRGYTFLVASGDTGTGCEFCTFFYPTFPATSPYVTTVGATQFIRDSIGEEMATRTFSSGGGFSWHFEQPDYQTQFITHYFATVGYLPEAHFYNRNGRGIPDISALGIAYQIILNGQLQYVYGTAASTSTVAAIISLLNEVRLVHNKPPLGFLNPFLYQTSLHNPGTLFVHFAKQNFSLTLMLFPSNFEGAISLKSDTTKIRCAFTGTSILIHHTDAFFDVVKGNNRYGCCGWTGFYTTAGWDPVTGLGTPNYAKLYEIVKHLP